MDTGKHPMQALLLSSRRFTHRFYRESAIDISGQVHRCGFSAEGKTRLNESTFDLYWLHMDNRYCGSRTLFLHFQAVALR